MSGKLLRLAWLFSAIFGSFATPYGNIGCHFSAVCTETEDCIDDNLFGSCVSSESVYLPFYDVSKDGFRNLKIVIRLLLDRGYQWKDEAAQKTLQTILGQYRSEYLDPEVELEQQMQLDQELQREQDREQDLAKLEALADQYGPLFSGRKTNTRLEEQRRAADFIQNEEARGLSEDDMEDLIEEYVQALENSPDLMEQEVNYLYQEYYQKYLDLFRQYRALEEAADQGLNEVGENPAYYAQVQDKLDYVKQYLNQLYETSKMGLPNAPSEEGEMGSYESSQSEASQWWESSSSESITDEDIEEDIEEVIEDGIDRLAVQLITNELIPQMTPQEQEQWRQLDEADKEAIIEDALDAIDFVETEMQEEEMEAEEEEARLELEREMMQGDQEEEEEALMEEAMANEDEENEGDNEQPLFQPEQNNGRENELMMNVLEKKGDDEGDIDVVMPTSGGEDTEDEKDEDRSKDSSSSDYVSITFAETIGEEQAENIVTAIAILLDLPYDVFSEVQVKENQVTFHVNASSLGFTPTDIAVQIADQRAALAHMMGVHEMVTGVGHDPVKVVSSGSPDNSALVILTVVLVACVIGILIAIVTVYCVRKRANDKAKVTDLKQEKGPPNEASDYQDLCRQRMACKGDKPEPLTRVMSSGAASDGAQPSPSSRSSTSSWSEEPVQSNMDISTGHVVLSYMEDHLNNKDRLSKEWEALCNYEADPNSTEAGNKEENLGKNRVKTAVPFDHTRVKLNEATNANKSDYINASAIMDIDPRAPAYITTQAPMASTLADFWQMVWEQGSVVIVNLTHVSETDINRCRYWPDEGSALYHCYEVHLVSEHVWCEDYLVRSFYLKNLETQETRTVTQFHFLTWPETGIPPSPKALLEFRRKVNKSFRGRACPIVVHCSDGVGRTGTYCLLDLVLTRMLKGVKELDIAATLEHIRDQRPGMVQSQAQFEYALASVVEEVNAILKALPQ